MGTVHLPAHRNDQGATVPENLLQLYRQSGQSRTGCPFHKVKTRLQECGVKQSLQRTMLGWLLFAQGDRHVTAERLYEEARRARVPVSLASVYNTLRLFTNAGLLRELGQHGSRNWYDTDVGSHYHFYVDELDQIFDIPASCVKSAPALHAPDGMEIVTVDVIVNLRTVRGAS